MWRRTVGGVFPVRTARLPMIAPAVLVLLATGSAVRAEGRAASSAPPPPSPPPPVVGHVGEHPATSLPPPPSRALLPPPRAPLGPPPAPRESIVDQVQREVDRGNERVKDDLHVDLDRWEHEHEAQLGERPPATALQRFRWAYERAMEIARIRRLPSVGQIPSSTPPRVRPDDHVAIIPPEMEPPDHQGPRPTSGPQSDPVADVLKKAERVRDRALAAAATERDRALADLAARHPQSTPDVEAARTQIENRYKLQKGDALDRYGRTRAAALGLWGGL